MALSIPELQGIPGLTWSSAEQTGDGTTITTVIHGKSTAGASLGNTLFLALGSGTGSRVGEYGFYAGHVIKYGYGLGYDEVTITAIELSLPLSAGYYSTFRAVANTSSVPLESKRIKVETNDETYKVWWNHEVRALDTADALSGGEITTLKAIENLADAGVPDGYYWAKTNQAMKTGEKSFLDSRYPGVQSYAAPTEKIQEIIYARDLSTVKAIIAVVGYLKFPEDYAGIPYDSTRIDNSKWLITSASYKKTFGWYEADVRYSYAKGGWGDRGAVAPATGIYPVAT